MNKHRLEFAVNAGRLGLLAWEVESLIKDARILQRWSEAECNGDIQQDETSGKYFRHYGQGGPGPFLTVKTADRQTPARKRIQSIAKDHGLIAYFQTDPRGCPVYLCKPEEANDQAYYHGLAVC